MLEITEKQIKTIAKNVTALFKEQGGSIKHSNVLETFSHALGFKDYNALSASLKRGTGNTYTPISIVEYAKKVKKEIEQEYPPHYSHQFVLLQKTSIYDVFIDREGDGESFAYFTLIKLKETTTNRVYYSPKYRTFSLFIYPDVKMGQDPYDIVLHGEKDKLSANCLEIVRHLNGKQWMTQEILDDLIKLMFWVVEKKDKLDTFENSFSKGELEHLYLKKLSTSV